MNITNTPAGTTAERSRSIRNTSNLLIVGSFGVLLSIVITTAVAALTGAVGVDFSVSDGRETIPLSGIAFVTCICSVIGVAVAWALDRWVSRAPERFVQLAIVVTAISLVFPFVVGADSATAVTLAGLHIVSAVVMTGSLMSWLNRSA